MKLQPAYLLWLPVSLLISGCSDTDGPLSGADPLPIELSASGEGLAATTKAAKEIIPFNTTIFATTKESDYSNLSTTDGWQRDAAVNNSGTVTFDGQEAAPNYPRYGGWIYLVAVAPKVTAQLADGKVSFTLPDDGQTDLMHAAQIQGNRWDGFRFSGNKVTANDKPLDYAHLLTQLKFVAKKKTAGGPEVKVKSITVNALKSVSIDLATGKATFSNNSDMTLTPTNAGTAITTSPTDLGCLLLPPLAAGAGADAAYKLTVDTSVGKFEDLPIKFEPSSGDAFAQGHSHEITLNIDDRELKILSVTVAEWTPVQQGDDLVLVE